MIDDVERARRYVAKCRPAVSGQRGHDSAFYVAMVLVHGFALSVEQALLLMREYNSRCVPVWSEAELVHKVRSAAMAQSGMGRGYLLGGMGLMGAHGTHGPHPPSGHPLPSDGRGTVASGGDLVAAAEGFLKGFRCGEADLCHASPAGLEGDPQLDGATLVRALYAPGEMINFVTEFAEHTDKSGEVKARPMGKGITLERDALVARFHANGSDTSRAGGWLRMNPVDGRGIGDANVTAFRFALLESDTLPLELQLSLVARLPLPVAVILSSGGRSVHAWVKVDARDADEYRSAVARLLGILARFGVDGKNKNPSRLSRLPGARRRIRPEGDGVQRLMYLNPAPEERSIL